MTTMTQTGTQTNGTAQAGDILLEVKNLKMYFPVTAGIIFQRAVAQIKAVDDVSFFVRRGETLGLVGESGCGKTTTGRCILQLYRPTSGQVVFDGQELTGLSTRNMRVMRRQMQVVFQDPYSSLNPRYRESFFYEDLFFFFYEESFFSGLNLQIQKLYSMQICGILVH